MVTALKINPTQNDLIEHPPVFFYRIAAIGAITLVAQLIVFCFEVVIVYYIADAYLGKIPSVKESMRLLGRRSWCTTRAWMRPCSASRSSSRYSCCGVAIQKFATEASKRLARSYPEASPSRRAANTASRSDTATV